MKRLIFAISTMFVLTCQSFAAQNCPVNAMKAGLELWPVGQLGLRRDQNGDASLWEVADMRWWEHSSRRTAYLQMELT